MNGIEAWLVVWGPEPHQRAVRLDHEAAVLYAAKMHGTVHPLVRGDL